MDIQHHMSDLQKHVGPAVLEASVLLRNNSDPWIRSAPQLVHEVMKKEIAAKLRDEGGSSTMHRVNCCWFFEGEADDL